MTQINVTTAVDDRDIIGAKALYGKALRRNMRGDPLKITMSVAHAMIYTTMSGLTEALPADQVRSLMMQMVDQAEQQIMQEKA